MSLNRGGGSTSGGARGESGSGGAFRNDPVNGGRGAPSRGASVARSLSRTSTSTSAMAAPRAAPNAAAAAAAAKAVAKVASAAVPKAEPTGVRGPIAPDGTARPVVDRQSWADVGLRGVTTPQGAPRSQPASYGTNYQTAQTVRSAYPNIEARTDQTGLTRALDTFSRAMPGEANVMAEGTQAMPNIGRVGINQMVRNISPNSMLAGMDTTGMRPATVGMNRPSANSMGMVEENSPYHTLGAAALSNAVQGVGVTPEAYNATNFVAANTPMVRGVRSVGAPVMGTQYGVDPTGARAVSRRNSVAQGVLDSMNAEAATGIAAAASPRPAMGMSFTPSLPQSIEPAGISGVMKDYGRLVTTQSGLTSEVPDAAVRNPSPELAEALARWNNPPIHNAAPGVGMSYTPSLPQMAGSTQPPDAPFRNYANPGLPPGYADAYPSVAAPGAQQGSLIGGIAGLVRQAWERAPDVATTIADQAVANTRRAIADDPLTALGHWMSIGGAYEPNQNLGGPERPSGNSTQSYGGEPEQPIVPPVVQSPGISSPLGWDWRNYQYPYGGIFGLFPQGVR